MILVLLRSGTFCVADFKRLVSWQPVAAGAGLETKPKIKVRWIEFVNNYCEKSVNFTVTLFFFY